MVLLGTDKNIITSSIKVFEILEIIINRGHATISELSKLSGYSQSTTQRIVNTLKFAKYINQNPSNFKYFPSTKIYELGSKVNNNMAIKNIARPYLENLYNEVEETVNLGVLDEDNVIYVDKLVSKSPLRAELEIGIKFPIYPSALGKAIAAFTNREYSFKGNYIKYTEKTITSDEKLYLQLENIKTLGYAVDDEEYVKGLVCISVPILNPDNIAVASISVSMPKERYHKNREIYFVSKLNECRQKIQHEIYGFKPHEDVD